MKSTQSECFTFYLHKPWIICVGLLHSISTKKKHTHTLTQQQNFNWQTNQMARRFDQCQFSFELDQRASFLLYFLFYFLDISIIALCFESNEIHSFSILFARITVVEPWTNPWEKVKWNWRLNTLMQANSWNCCHTTSLVFFCIYNSVCFPFSAIHNSKQCTMYTFSSLNQ